MRRRGQRKRLEGHPPEWWEKENARLILFRVRAGLDLLPWMEEWLEKRGLTVRQLYYRERTRGVKGVGVVRLNENNSVEVH